MSLGHRRLADRELGMKIEWRARARRERRAAREGRPRAVVDEHQAAATAVLDARVLGCDPRRAQADVTVRSTTDDDRRFAEAGDHSQLTLVQTGKENSSLRKGGRSRRN